MRRFALLALRDFGVGKKGLDEIVQTEASVLTGQLEIYANENDGVISDIPAKMQAATANVIHNVIFGYRYVYIIIVHVFKSKQMIYVMIIGHD